MEKQLVCRKGVFDQISVFFHLFHYFSCLSTICLNELIEFLWELERITIKLHGSCCNGNHERLRINDIYILKHVALIVNGDELFSRVNVLEFKYGS